MTTLAGIAVKNDDEQLKSLLASQGNASAKTVVEELEKRGIPIKAAAQPSK